jgi:hypothetical protein
VSALCVHTLRLGRPNSTGYGPHVRIIIRDIRVPHLRLLHYLSFSGKTVLDEEVADILVMNLNPAFDTAHTAIITCTNEPSLAEVEAALEAYDMDHRNEFKQSMTEMAMVARIPRPHVAWLNV